MVCWCVDAGGGFIVPVYVWENLDTYEWVRERPAAAGKGDAEEGGGWEQVGATGASPSTRMPTSALPGPDMLGRGGGAYVRGAMMGRGGFGRGAVGRGRGGY